MKKGLISVVVPIYNLAEFLPKCLDSLLNQTFLNYEIILVDDGSMDESPSMCDKYAELYEKVSVVHKKNGGLSSARNAGLEQAKGMYVCFVDADDYITEDYLCRLYEKAEETNADMVIADYREVEEQGNIIVKELGQPPRQGCMDRRQLLWALTSVGECHYATTVVVAWNKLIRREIMCRHFFPEGRLHEDEYVIMPLLLECGHVEWIEEVVYLYRQRQGSIM